MKTPVLFLGSIFFLSCSCSSPTSSVNLDTTTVTVSASQFTSPKDVFLVLSNASGADVPAPAVTTSAPTGYRGLEPGEASSPGASPLAQEKILHSNLSYKPKARSGSRSLGPTLPSPNLDAVGKTLTLNSRNSDLSSVVSVTGTVMELRKVTTANYGPRQLTVVVDNAASGVTSAMVTALADHFLEADNQDIYDWVTQIYGPEIEPLNSALAASNPSFLPDDGCLTILVTPLSQAGASSYVVGFVYPGDSYSRSDDPNSNERRMFTINSQILAQADNGSPWSPTARGPSQVFSTIAHEFQHLIQVYRRNILKGVYEPTWLNEMMSMATQDMVSDKLDNPEPLGIQPSKSQGSALTFDQVSSYTQMISNDYLCGFCAQPSWSLFSWSGNSSTVIKNYNTHTAFAAFLLRNYGGPSLLRSLMNSDQAGLANLWLALKNNGYTDTQDIPTILKKWAEAALNSNQPREASQGPTLNRGGYFSFTLPAFLAGGPSASYNLSSVNMFLYRPIAGFATFVLNFVDPVEGSPNALNYPALVSSGTLTLANNSNLYLRVGRHINSDFSITASLPAGVTYSLFSVDMINPNNHNY